MKKSLNYLIKSMLLLVLIAFTGCEKDLYENSIQNSTREMHVREISLKDIEKRVSTRIKGEIKKVKNMKYETTGEGNRIEHNSELDIYIDTDNGNLVSVDGKDFYTFPMFKDDDDKIENVLFVDNGNGEMDTYLIKYNVKPEEFDNLTNEQIQDIDAEYQKIFWSGGEYVCFTWSSSTTVYPDCPYPNGTHSNGAQCDGEIQVSSATLCTWVEDFGSGNDGQTGGGDVGGVGGDTSGGGTSGGTSSGNTIHTGIGTSPELIKLKEFIKSLTDDQEAWYVENPNAHESIQEYVEENNYSAESEYFVTGMIETCIENGGTFVIDDSITEENSIDADNFDEFQSFLDSLPNEGIEEEYEIDGNQKTASVKVWFALPMGGTKFFVKQTTSPNYNIEDVTSNAFGVTLAFSWNQTTYDVSINETTNIATVNVFGVLNYNAYFEGLGTVYSSNKHVQIKLNTLTGNIISTTVID